MDEKPSSDDKPPASIQIQQYLRQLGLRIVIYLLIYFFIAFITIGPCFWYWFEATYVNENIWVAKFYAPLLWMCNHIDFICWLVNKYINWWIL